MVGDSDNGDVVTVVGMEGGANVVARFWMVSLIASFFFIPVAVNRDSVEAIAVTAFTAAAAFAGAAFANDTAAAGGNNCVAVAVAIVVGLVVVVVAVVFLVGAGGG